MPTTINVNGRTIHIEGNATGVSISNGVVTVGGKVVASDLSGVVRIEWSGPLASLKADAPVSVQGDVAGDVDAEGPVTCRDVTGSVRANGPVTCGRVGGNLKANGPVITR
jgi:cytoskeletal protein CcmA (bactofilin family)